MPKRIRVTLGAATAAALVLAGGTQYVGSAAEIPPSAVDRPMNGLVAVSVEGRFYGMVRPETLVRESANGMTRQTTPVRPRALSATANLARLTVRRIDRTGATMPVRPDELVSIRNLDDSAIEYAGPAGVIELPVGRYAVSTIIYTPRAGREQTYSLITHPELVLAGDVDLTLDARVGQRVSMSTDNPAVRGGDYKVVMASKISDCSCVRALTMETDPRFDEVYAATVPGTRSDTFALGHTLHAFDPALELVSTGAEPFDVPASWLPDSPTPAQRATLGAAYAGAGTDEELAGLNVAGKLVLLQLPGDIGSDDLLRRLAAVAARGGRMAMLTFTDVPAALTTTADEQPVIPALPTMYGFGPTVRRFFDRVRTEASSVSVVSRNASAVRYQLVHGVMAAVTAPVTYRPATTELAAVPTTYHEAGPARPAGVRGAMSFFGSTLGTTWDIPVDTPQARTEYFTPGDWQLSSGSLTDTRSVVKGVNPPLAWNKAVAGPTFTGTTFSPETREPRPWAYRDGNAVDVILPMFGDSAGRPRTPSVDAGDTGSISLYRDGEQVGTVDVPDAARFTVTPKSAGYRLRATATRTVAQWPLSTTVTADWTFRSGAADSGRSLPLMTVRFDPAVDPTNRVTGGRSFTIPTYAPDATSLTVDVSYDDGATWRPATVKRLKERFAVTVDHPAAGFASLRARAVGPNGTTVEQTVLRAYRIGG